MTNLKTNDRLLNALTEAKNYKMTAEEIRRQRISFVMGSLSLTNTMTRADVEAVMDAQEGRQGELH